ncbi:MAG TPA: alpha/beta fold hydrolase [Pyrinomonadaceae bacterium]|jgi:pimeloyl-ACP methyl ester carboxylesterase/DNA-binding winged helix-turn-helix (wHTH) protein|nr:alpha/beta fold hydrolase [Pyrinomonadaceae bacterium]
MMNRPARFYLFDSFRVDVNERLLFKDNREVSLTPKVFDTLLVLLENSSHVMTKKELMQQVWPDSFVEENNLAQNISILRKALGQSPGGEQYIQTVPKRGYRFVGDVRATGGEEESVIVRERTRARIVVERDDEDLAAGARVIDVVPTVIAPKQLEPALQRPPETMYARSGDVNIAYQVIGDAPLDLVFVMGWVSHLEYFWREPCFARFLLRLASFSRLILFDKRGTGLSDRVPINQLPTLEQRMDDVRAVMDAVGSERAALIGVSEGGPMCSLFAATYPEKTLALVMIGTYAKRIRDEEYPWGPTLEQREQFFEVMREQWGGPVGIDERAPSVADDPEFRDWWATYLRMGASPGAAVALTQMNAEIDVRNVLPSIRVPSLVIHRSEDQCLKVEEGRFVAQRIPGAKFVELPGNDHLPFVGDQDAILDEVEEFLTGVRHPIEPDTVLATVLVARLVGTKERVQNLGPERWAEWWRRLHAHITKEIEWFRGREVDILENRLLAIFDGPARAIRCATAITEYTSRLGVQTCTGLHTGECEIVDGQVAGAAAQMCVCVANESEPGEVLVSSTVKDLVAGSGISFEDRGVHMLAGCGESRLFGVVKAQL